MTGYIVTSEELNNKIGEAIYGAMFSSTNQKSLDVPHLRDEIVNIVKTGKPVHCRFKTPPVPGSELFEASVVAWSAIVNNEKFALEAGTLPQYIIRYTSVEFGISVQIVSDGANFSKVYAQIEQ